MSFVEWFQSLPEDTKSAIWTISVASVASVMCALLGVWMVLQRVSMLGDAISHSVLPGLVVTFLLFGTRASFPMFLGAAVAGLLTVVLTRLITHVSGVRDDASMGVVFTVLFALGVILITRFAKQVDLDPGCVLYGLIEFVPLNLTRFAGMDVPIDLLKLVPALVLTGAFLLLFRKELLILAFDPALAKALGKRPDLIYYALMALVAIATVASFEAVGSILVIAMLIGPAATAQLFTRKLKPLFGLAAVFAVLASICGYWSAVRWNTSVAGMMAVWLGLFYAIAVVFSPTGGLLYSWFERRARLQVIQNEDGLAAIYRLRETGTSPTIAAIRAIVGDQWFNASALNRLEQRRLVERHGQDYQLTGAGRSAASQLVRKHRLLETYLVQQMEQPAEAVHGSAHRSEHYLTPAGVQEVRETLQEPTTDPHGKPIPEEE